MDKKNNEGTETMDLSVCKLPAIKDDNQQTNQKKICKITGEFVEGFNFIGDINKAVTIFGSSRSLPDNFYYQEATKLAELLAKEHVAVITGGGPGIMEAGNKGASEAGGESIGINIELPKHQPQNKYVAKSICLDHFFARKVMLVKPSKGYVFFPGGFGTLDEFFEVMNLAETKELGKAPLIVAVGKDYWQPLLDWLEKDVYGKDKYINIEDLKLVKLVDSAKEAFEIIKTNFRD